MYASLSSPGQDMIAFHHGFIFNLSCDVVCQDVKSVCERKVVPLAGTMRQPFPSPAWNSWRSFSFVESY